MFETKEGLEKGMREATKNLEGARGLAKSQHWRQQRNFLDPPEFSLMSLVMKFMPFSRPSLVCGLLSKSSQL